MSFTEQQNAVHIIDIHDGKPKLVHCHYTKTYNTKIAKDFTNMKYTYIILFQTKEFTIWTV